MYSKSSGADTSVLASAFDALVAVFVKTAKVFPHVLLPAGDDVTLSHSFEP